MVSPKKRLYVRIDENLDAEIDETLKLWETQIGVKVNKTTIVESAISKGLEEIKQILEGGEASRIRKVLNIKHQPPQA